MRKRRTTRSALRAAAERHDWQVVAEFVDRGISGAKGRKDRPALDNLLRGAMRREFDLVAAWSVDRLRRSLQDLLSFLSELHAKHIDLYLHQQGVDTTTPRVAHCSRCAGSSPSSSVP